jgi:hypothetical protein
VTLLSFVAIMASVFFKAMIVWRGFSLSINFEQIMEDAVKIIANIMSLPAMEYLFYPITYMFNLFSTFEIDLEAVAITCQGASAPMELFINMIVVGLAVIIIESDYQLFRAISFKSVCDLFFEAAMQPTYRKWTTHRHNRVNGVTMHRTIAGAWQYARVLLGIVFVSTMANFDVFQGFLQYLMSCLTLKSFLANNGIHAHSDSCNNVPGYRNFDTYIALGTSVEAWLLFLPFFYEVSKLLVP